MDKILLIDGQNMIWKAHVVVGKPITHELSNQECLCGEDTNWEHICRSKCACGSDWDHSDNRCFGDKYLMVYNFFRSLRATIEQFKPDKCFFVLEGHPEFRYQLFAEYKANRIIKTGSRSESQEKVHEAGKIIIDLLKYLPITLARAAKYEGDDVIGTLCENLKDEDITVISSDTDFIQLLQRKYKSCAVYDTRKKEYFESPDYSYVFWKALCGDTADNIPGFDKIGKKTAIKMLKDPDRLMNFLSLEENRANFNIYRQLIEFQNVPEEEIEFTNGVSEFNILRNKFVEMRFNSLVGGEVWDKFCNTFNCIKF